MRIMFAVVLALHALVHSMGFLKAFELARLEQLTLPISRTMGGVWLAAMALLLGASVALFAAPRWFWLLGALGVVASQVAIATSWADARFGTIVNVLTLGAVVYGAAAWGPFGLDAEYRERTSRRLAQLVKVTPVTEAELALLPLPVQRYLRYVGVVGQPHVRAFRVRFTGRIRTAPDAAWMPFRGEQHNFLEPPARLFFMQATMRGLPVDALHAYEEDGARMRVKVLSLFPVVDAKGTEFTRAETVTVFNDMCILAPATLVSPKVRWKERDARSVEAAYTNGPYTIHAVLTFDDTGALVNFWSDDRPALAPDGVSFVPQRWSTPVSDYRAQGAFRLASRGEARYAAPSGEYAYVQFDGLDVSYDLGPKF
jgi:hypothetical protein